MEKNFGRASPYQRGGSIRLKCVAKVTQSVATSFTFEHTVSADLISKHFCALTDGSSVYSLTLTEENEGKVALDHTYIFRNLGLKNQKAFINANTEIYRTSNMPVEKEVLDKAQKLLCPTSIVTQLDEVRSTKDFVTVQGQITSITLPRKARTQSGVVPITDVVLSDKGCSEKISLWREAGLTSLKVGEWVQITHLKAMETPDFGFKLNSSTFSKISPCSPSTYEVAVKIEAVMETEEHFVLLLDTGVNLKVPCQAWQGTLDDFIERLPVSAILTVNGDIVTSPEKLFENEK